MYSRKNSLRYVIICLASCSTLLPLVKMICAFVGLVHPLVVLICPFIIIVFSFVCSLVLRVCSLVVLVWPLIGPLVFLAVLSVGLFFYNWSMHFDVFFFHKTVIDFIISLGTRQYSGVDWASWTCSYNLAVTCVILQFLATIILENGIRKIIGAFLWK